MYSKRVLQESQPEYAIERLHTKVSEMRRSFVEMDGFSGLAIEAPEPILVHVTRNEERDHS